jgi:hypothetical protein
MPRSISQNAPVLNRREFTLGALVASAAFTFPALSRSASAKQTTDLTTLGLPSLDISLSMSGYEGVPESTPAGRYLVTLSIGDDVEEGAVAFVQPPAGMTAADFLAAVGVGQGGGTPEASPAAEESEEDVPLPSFVYKATFAGGVYGAAGTTASAVIDLGEGEWFAWGDDPEAPVAPVIFNATESAPGAPAEPAADLKFTLYEFGIMVEGTMTAGDHIVQVENVGAQPHFLQLEMVPAGTTNDDLTALIESFMSGTPVPGGITESDFTPVTYTPTQSIGISTWRVMSLEAGTYDAVCFFPNAGTGTPHAFMGMHTVFEVSG